MKFYNRKNELENLREIKKLSGKQAQMTVIIGRRRVGKTELIRYFLQNEQNSFYFFVERKKSLPLLEEFTEILKQKYPLLAGQFRNWDDFFKFLFEISAKKQISIIFDEFQNFKFVDPSIFSILQKHWDLNCKQSKLNLTLVGSVITLMEKIFRGSKEPLFGRVSHKIYLEPFEPPIVKNLLADCGKKDSKNLLDFYTVFGGIPKYYAELENKSQFKENDFFKILNNMFFGGDGILKEEGYDLLSQEFGKNYQTYFSILQIIASGSTRASEIADKAGIPVTAIARYLDTLSEKYKFIKKKNPVFSERSKNSRYYLNDRFLIFWFRYIFRFKSLIEIGKSGQIIDFIKKDIGNLQGFVFEDIARSYILDEDKKGKFAFSIEGIGNFWDKTGNEIDLIAFSESEKKIVFLECKLSPKRINQEIINSLKEKSKFVKWNIGRRKEYFGVCAAGKIDPKIKKYLTEQEVIVYEF